MPVSTAHSQHGNTAQIMQLLMCKPQFAQHKWCRHACLEKKPYRVTFAPSPFHGMAWHGMATAHMCE